MIKNVILEISRGKRPLGVPRLHRKNHYEAFQTSQYLNVGIHILLCDKSKNCRIYVWPENINNLSSQNINKLKYKINNR